MREWVLLPASVLMLETPLPRKAVEHEGWRLPQLSKGAVRLSGCGGAGFKSPSSEQTGATDMTSFATIHLPLSSWLCPKSMLVKGIGTSLNEYYRLTKTQ